MQDHSNWNPHWTKCHVQRTHISSRSSPIYLSFMMPEGTRCSIFPVLPHLLTRSHNLTPKLCFCEEPHVQTLPLLTQSLQFNKSILSVLTALQIPDYKAFLSIVYVGSHLSWFWGCWSHKTISICHSGLWKLVKKFWNFQPSSFPNIFVSHEKWEKKNTKIFTGPIRLSHRLIKCQLR